MSVSPVYSSIPSNSFIGAFETEESSLLYDLCSGIFKTQVTIQQLEDIEGLLADCLVFNRGSEQALTFIRYTDENGMTAFEKALFSYNLALVKLLLRYWPEKHQPSISRMVHGQQKELKPIAALLWDLKHPKNEIANVSAIEKKHWIHCLLQLNNSKLGILHESYECGSAGYPLLGWIKNLDLAKEFLKELRPMEGTENPEPPPCLCNLV